MIRSYIDTLILENITDKYEKVTRFIFTLRKYRDTGDSLFMFQKFLSKRQLESKGLDFTSLFILEYQKFVDENIDVIYNSYKNEFIKISGENALEKEKFRNFVRNRIMMYITFETKSVIEFINNILENANITPDNLDVFVEYIVENKNESNMFSLGYLDDFLLKFIFSNVINGNSPVMIRIQERIPDLLENKDTDKKEKLRDDYMEILEKVNRDYNKRKSEYEKQIKEINKKIDKLSPKKKEGTPEEEYYKSIRKSKLKEEMKNIKSMLLMPFKKTVVKLYNDIKSKSPFMRLFDYFFKQSIKIAKFIDKKYGAGIFSDVTSGRFGKVFDKLFGDRKKRKVEKLQRLKKYYEENFGEINRKLMQDDISKGLYGDDYSVIPDDKKTNVDKIVDSIINARLEDASIIENILNDEIKEENIKNKDTSFEKESIDESESKKDKNKNRKRKILSKNKKIDKKNNKITNRREERRKIRELKRKVRSFYKRKGKAELSEQDNILLEKVKQSVCPQHFIKPEEIQKTKGINLDIKEDLGKKENIEQQEIQDAKVLKREAPVPDNNQEQIKEEKEYNFLDEKEHEKMLESMAYESERDKNKKGRDFSRLIKNLFNVKGKKSSFKDYQKKYGLEKPKSVNIENFKNKKLKVKVLNIKSEKNKKGLFSRRRLNFLKSGGRNKMDSVSSKMGGRLFGSKGATYGKDLGKSFGRAFGNISKSAGRFANILGKLRFLRFSSLISFFMTPAGWVVLAIVLIIAVTAAVLYAYFTFLKFFKLFKPTVEYSAAKAIDTYKMAEMEEKEKEKIQNALKDRLKRISERKFDANQFDKLYDYSALSAGDAKESELITSNDNKSNKTKRYKTERSKDIKEEKYDVFSQKKEDIQQQTETNEKYNPPDYSGMIRENNTAMMHLIRSYSQITGVVTDTQTELYNIHQQNIKVKT
ncbi:MAG: hypothetical protein QXF12_00255 [Candidatus Aenigmatarchaeota archaeon]